MLLSVLTEDLPKALSGETTSFSTLSNLSSSRSAIHWSSTMFLSIHNEDTWGLHSIKPQVNVSRDQIRRGPVDSSNLFCLKVSWGPHQARPYQSFNHLSLPTASLPPIWENTRSRISACCTLPAFQVAPVIQTSPSLWFSQTESHLEAIPVKDHLARHLLVRLYLLEH